MRWMSFPTGLYNATTMTYLPLGLGAAPIPNWDVSLQIICVKCFTLSFSSGYEKLKDFFSLYHIVVAFRGALGKSCHIWAMFSPRGSPWKVEGSLATDSAVCCACSARVTFHWRGFTWCIALSLLCAARASWNTASDKMEDVFTLEMWEKHKHSSTEVISYLTVSIKKWLNISVS